MLNVLLTTTTNQYNLSLTFLGPLDKMQTNYVSDPQLPTADIINLIAPRANYPASRSRAFQFRGEFALSPRSCESG